jgi:hypothetical protein
MVRKPDSHYLQAKNTQAYVETGSIPPQTAIREALKTFGAISCPYLQTKCKISYKRAAEEIKKHKLSIT